MQIIDTEPLGFEKADETGRLWIVPNRVASIQPCPEHPSIRSRLTLAGGRYFTVVGSAEEIAAKLRERVGRELGVHPAIYLASNETSSPADSEIEPGRAGAAAGGFYRPR